MVTASFPLCLTQGVHPIYPCVSVSIRGPKTKLRKLTERQRKQAIWPRMDTDTHGCGLPASSRSTGRRLEQNCMVMFWRNAILGRYIPGRTCRRDEREPAVTAVD